MNYFGRRTVCIWRERVLWLPYLSLLELFYRASRFSSSGWTIGALAMLSSVVYDMTVGPVCYVIVPEISSLRQRIKTAALARARTIFRASHWVRFSII